MKKHALVVINEQHRLTQQQEAMLNNTYDIWTCHKVPCSGWDLQHMVELAHTWKGWISSAINVSCEVVFVSPIPVLIRELASTHASSVKIFHNDKREKVETPSGKVIFKVAETGWKLV